MASPANNLFLRLHKWASRQDENFLTESLAVVLEQLLILAPAVGTHLVERLTGGFITLAPEDASAIEIHTQVEAGQGRPDMEIRTTHQLVWVEVKTESGLRTGQLEGYRVLLGESGVERTQLILLTRYPESFQPEATRPDFEVRWVEVADWLESEIERLEATNEIAGFLARQFLDFLGARSMKLAQVGKYLPEGIRALSDLMNMLFETAAACKVTSRKAVGLDYFGIYLDNLKYWIGVLFNDPEKLWFCTCCPINSEAAAKIGGSVVSEENWAKWPDRKVWWREADLNSELIHFFVRSKISQIEWLESFLQECLAQARSIEKPDQPPILEEPEERI